MYMYILHIVQGIELLSVFLFQSFYVPLSNIYMQKELTKLFRSVIPEQSNHLSELNNMQYLYIYIYICYGPIRNR